jgi:16S rRNA U516 pseudouridylate synthase RsuA-like enzyme
VGPRGKNVVVWLDEGRHQKLREIARQAGLPMISVVRIALEIALELAQRNPEDPFRALVRELAKLKRERKENGA